MIENNKGFVKCALENTIGIDTDVIIRGNKYKATYKYIPFTCIRSNTRDTIQTRVYNQLFIFTDKQGKETGIIKQFGVYKAEKITKNQLEVLLNTFHKYNQNKNIVIDLKDI